MHFNIQLTSVALLFSTLLVVNTSPVPNDGLALFGLTRRSDMPVFGRDIHLERRQKGGPGGARGAGASGAGGGVRLHVLIAVGAVI
jgi:hypothetical protein